jgi:hypothetical protein
MPLPAFTNIYPDPQTTPLHLAVGAGMPAAENYDNTRTA